MKPVFSTLLITLLVASTTTFAESPDAKMIDHHQKTYADESEALEKATPARELRPAATSKNKVRPPAEAAKDPIITQQKEDAAKSIAETKSAKPAVENRPAATTKHK